MRVGVIGKDKPERNFITVYNAESSASIPVGTPVIFSMPGTLVNNLDNSDGSAVVLPSSSSAGKSHTLVAGIVNGITQPSTAGFTTGLGVGMACQVAGICNYTIISFTRSASTANWGSQVYALGDILSVDTVNNALAWASSAQSVLQPQLFAVAQASTLASQTSSVGGAATVTTFALKTFLRVM